MNLDLSCRAHQVNLQEQEQRNNSVEAGKSVGDLNMKLKLEIGALRGENEGLNKKNDEVVRQLNDLENQLQVGPCFQLSGSVFVISRRLNLAA